jgi:hypothetical protein
MALPPGWLINVQTIQHMVVVVSPEAGVQIQLI